jgi:hypothetical protein
MSRNVKYTIGTLVNNFDEYLEMRKTFIEKGFRDDDCEFIIIDNSEENKMDGFNGLNHILNCSSGEYVILCHQDIRMIFDDRKKLDLLLEELTAFDEKWAIAGNAGGGEQEGTYALRISDPYNEDWSVGSFPAKVASVDENFFIVRRKKRVGFSEDLYGFHFYGADICLHAKMSGYNCYVINFLLQHLGKGDRNPSFFNAKERFEEKWRQHLLPRTIQTTCTLVNI